MKGENGNKINVGLIGYGYWGVNLLRNLVESPYNGKVCVCDLKPERLKQAQHIYPNIETTTDWRTLLTRTDISAIAIATPTSSHYELARTALQNGKHVLAEKPLVTRSTQVEELMRLAQDKNLVLMVDHTFLYNDVVRKMKSYIQSGETGRISYVDATRINLGIYQKDINVLWDLACHDISVVNYIIEEQPTHVRAIGKIHPGYETEDMAYLFLHYPSGLLVQISTSWASPVKIRKMMVGGEKKMIIYDDIEPTNKLTIYDYEAVETVGDKQKVWVDYRLGNISIPKYHLAEPLKMVVEDFFTSITTGRQPLSNGSSAYKVVRILEKAEQSLKQNGTLIALD